jgi:DnaJ-class molecular chaperone
MPRLPEKTKPCPKCGGSGMVTVQVHMSDAPDSVATQCADGHRLGPKEFYCSDCVGWGQVPA